MALSAQRAVEQARILYNHHLGERTQLDLIRAYLVGRQALPAVIPSDAPHEIKVMSRSSRVNIMPIVVNSIVQAVFVDGFRADAESTNAPVWQAWRANRMPARQTGIHRATFAYGTAYAVVLPGRPTPVIRGVSPRAMTCMYAEDPDWPMWALERVDGKLWRLYDDEAIYYLAGTSDGTGGTDSFTFLQSAEHGADVGGAPVVRFVDQEDLDAGDEVLPRHPLRGEQIPTFGQVAPLMPLQDQIDLTTLGLQIAQHFGAFRQRYIIGWVADSEEKRLKASAARVWTFDDSPEEVKVGEFEQTNLDGFIKSREASLRHAATLSQTPVHELIGDLVNMSAEALAAAEKGHERKADERETLLGEGYGQMFWLLGRYMRVDVPDDAQVVWRDTSARAFAATVDGLGKLVQMLGIPPQELWERVPGATQEDVRRWRNAAQQGDSFRFLADMLERQGAPTGEPSDSPVTA